MGKRKLSKDATSRPAPGRKSPWLFWGIAGLAAVVVAGVVGYLLLDAGRLPKARPGKPAPDFTLALFDGRSVTLSSLKGRPVLLNFWSSA